MVGGLAGVMLLAGFALVAVFSAMIGAHRRPTRARATALALKLGVAHAGGLSQRELRRHCRHRP
ncbi:hypothetical protein FVA95_27285 [Pseudonocardia sp. EV170527-09]|uniref:hypothetical protein n=1 Tax=Pseudonocardia sp. EV170527-09 TaxID=2603411 RepID=UPI0011F2989D|nr:hypothetical protein [Pseudonocardia sp. EV170527-09]KAA1012319.1 hypothetical protein FVA95_27285 [Pseudonocardia sp. EV170527-09]